jgi:hypothetical protein
MDCTYKNIQDSFKGGKKITRRVIIKHGKGHKSVCTYKNGKKCFNNKKQLSDSEMQLITTGVFIPGLFNDLFAPKKNSKSRTKKNRKNTKYL